MEVIPYHAKYSNDWDDFVKTSNNGTIFHTRKFLSYHNPRKFTDNSLIFSDEGKIAAVFTAASITKDNKKILTSHLGASYGGLVYKESLSLKQAFNLTEELIKYSKQNNFDSITVTNPPFIYQVRYNNYIDFAFMRNNFTYLKREVTSVISLDVKADDVFSLFKPEARTATRKAQKSGVEIKCTDDIAAYYEILENNLGLRHNVKPAHSLDELKKLMKLFHDDIQLIGAFVNNKMIAGVVNFYCNSKVVLVFYISHNPEYQNYRAVNLLFYSIIKDSIEKGLKFLDFGLFTVNMEPNWGLGKFKENFGARGILRDTFERKLP